MGVTGRDGAMTSARLSHSLSAMFSLRISRKRPVLALTPNAPGRRAAPRRALMC